MWADYIGVVVRFRHLFGYVARQNRARASRMLCWMRHNIYKATVTASCAGRWSDGLTEPLGHGRGCS